MKRFVFTRSAIEASIEMIPADTTVEKWVPLIFAPFEDFILTCPEQGWEIKVYAEDSLSRDDVLPDGLKFVIQAKLKASPDFDPSLTYCLVVWTTESRIRSSIGQDPRYPDRPDFVWADKNKTASAQLVSLFIRTLAYLNCPKLRSVDVVSNRKLNASRQKSGKPPLPDYIDIRPSALMKKFMQFKRDAAKGLDPEGMVRAHWKKVWCGPKTEPQRPEPVLVRPYKRSGVTGRDYRIT